jgi:N-acetylmuramoyl-L-alanine amidase
MVVDHRNDVADYLLVSIHLNSFPLEQYRGLQVWYSKNNPESAVLAERIRSTVKDSLQPENDRACKSATSSIYLLHHLHVPAVLVECGFLSNPDEAAKLADDTYRQKIAFSIFCSIIKYIDSEGDSEL